MASLSRRDHRSSLIWPGFVDALATLLLVIIFLLMIFVLAQFFLGQALSGRDQALKQLESDLSELSRVLALSRDENTQLKFGVESLQDQLSASLSARATLDEQLSSLRSNYAEAQARIGSLESQRATDQDIIGSLNEDNDAMRKELADLSVDVAALQALKAELEKEVTSLSLRVSQAETEADKLEKNLTTTLESLVEAQIKSEGLEVGLAEQREISETARAQLALMNQQMAALRQQLSALEQALEAAEADAVKKNVQIEALGQRLNAALASKVQELSRYRSEFFGRLREVIGNRRDVRIVGDRFVLQSELLFDKGAATIGENGTRELQALATTLLEIALTMPGDLDWILRVDGHTDSDPIATPQFPSNWELSTARALSVVKALIDAGIPPERLAATGFGEHYPIEAGNSEIAKSKNRRIEFKFTQR